MTLAQDALHVAVHDAVLLQMADSPEQIVDELHCSQLSEGSSLPASPFVNTLQIVGKERHDNKRDVCQRVVGDEALIKTHGVVTA